MSTDERVRDALRRRRVTAAATTPDLLEVVVRRGTRRRQARIAVVGLLAAAAVAVVAIGVPRAINESRLVGPVDSPTSGVPTALDDGSGWTPKVVDSPLDGRIWLGPTLTRPERMAALNGTHLERFGEAVYSRVLANAATYVTFLNGVVELRMWDSSGERPQALLYGTFKVRGKTVVIELDGVPGATTFRWGRVRDGIGEGITLTFAGTTVERLYGAPAEVFLRMWSLGTFWKPDALQGVS